MHKRTRACAISKKTKQRVYERDMGACIFCGAPGLPEAHVVPRSHGGLGCEENIVTVCRTCHDKLDNSLERQQMLHEAAEHLKRFYPDWDAKKYVYDKWGKDKGSKPVKEEKVSNDAHIKSKFAEFPQKDKEKEPPDGFYFLGGDDDRI